MTGVKVGSMKAVSAALGLWDSLARLFPAGAAGSVPRSPAVCAGSGADGPARGVATTFSGRRFLPSLLALAGGGEIANRRHLGTVASSMSRLRRRRAHSQGHAFFDALAGRSGLCCRFGKKLFEVLEKVGGRVKEARNLRVDVLDGLLLALVSLKNF